MTNNRVWTISVALGIGAIVLLGWFLGISPVLTQGSAAAAQAQQVSDQNIGLRASGDKLKAQFEKMPQLASQLEALKVEFPGTPALDGFLDQLQGLAQMSGVTISSFTAGEAVPYGGTAAAAAVPLLKPTGTAPASPTASPTPTPTPGSGASGAAGTATATQPSASLKGRLFTVPLTLGIKGSKAQVMAFTNASQLNSRFFLVTQVSLVAGLTSDDSSGTLTGDVFVFRSVAPVATPAG